MILPPLPEDIDFRASAAASAARVRGAEPLTDDSIGQDVSVALKCIGANQGLQSDYQLVALEDEESAAPLIAAARTLVSVAASLRKEGGEQENVANGLLLYAAVAYGMQGNFPSARAALATTSYSYAAQSSARRIAVTVCDPARAEQFLSLQDLGIEERYFHERWRMALGVPDVQCLHDCLDLFKIFALSGPFANRGLLLNAEVVARQAFRLSTAHLKTEAPEVPSWFVAQLQRTNRNTLLPPQRQLLIDRHIANSKNNSLLNLPTSTGKTLIAEASIAAAIRDGGVAVFVAPYVAIGEQVLQSMRWLFDQKANVVAMFGGFKSELPDLDLTQPQIIVSTPERFDGLLRTGQITPALKLIVLDEFHMVENGARGAKLEGMVARLRLLQDQGMPFRLMALSAVLPDATQLCTWLSVPQSDYYRVGWRPTARRLAVCRSDGRMTWIYGSDPLTPADRTAGHALGNSVRVSLPHRVRPALNYPSPSHSTESAENVAALALDLAARIPGPGLIVCPRKTDTRAVARAIANLCNDFEPDQDLLALADRIQQQYDWLSSLTGCIRKGVAFHNASLPFDVRRDIEAAVRGWKLKFVASTTTLAEGADFPFRWTILSHWLTGVHEGARPVKALTFRNIAGRSGRANAYPEGDTVVFENLLGHAKDIGSLESRTQRLGQLLFEQTPLTSTLATAEASTDDQERQAIEASFASQFLAAIPENPVNEDIAVSMARLTYAWASGEEEQVLALANRVMGELTDASQPGGPFAVVNSPAKLTSFGIAANRTGFSPGSCRIMVSFLFATDLPSAKHELLARVLKALSQLPEQSERLLRKVYGEGRYRSYVRPEDVPTVLQGLLVKTSPRDIFDALPKRVKSTAQESYIEGQFDDFVRFVDSIKAFLPWALRALERLSVFGGLDAALMISWEALANEVEGLSANLEEI